MGNKFISFIMFLITTVIIAVIILLGITLFDQLKNGMVFETSSGEVKLFEPDYSQLDDTVQEPIEVPQIKVETSEIVKTETSNNSNNQANKNTNSENPNYDNITINKHFFNQLEKYSQTIYKAFNSNKEKMKTGIYKIELGSAFSDVLSQQNGQNKLQEYYQSAIEAYLYDNPDIFYLNPKSMFLNIETTKKGNQTTYNTYIDCGSSANYLSQEFNSKEKIDTAISKIEKVKNNIVQKRTGNTYKDIKMVHDYLVKNVSYDSTFSRDNIYNMYGALVNNVCVCEGYAKAFKYLLNEIGIESTLVIGTGNNDNGESEKHAWNYVKVDGTWYAVDVTWDDPIIIGGGSVGDNVRYKYFLKGSTSMSKDHFPSGQFTENGKVFKYPSISTSDYKNN